MKKLLLILSFALMSISAFAQLGITVGADVASSYHWRGQHIGNFCIQPSVDYLSPYGLGVNVWFSSHSDHLFLGSKTELDYTVYYSYTIDDYTLSAGFINYVANASAPFAKDEAVTDPDDYVGNISELNFGVKFDKVLLTPSLKFYYNLSTSDGLLIYKYAKYVEVAGSYDFQLTEEYALSTSLAIGLGDRTYNFDDYTKFSIVNIFPKIALPLTFSDINITPSIGIGYNPTVSNKNVDKDGKELSPFTFVAGVGVYYAF